MLCCELVGRKLRLRLESVNEKDATALDPWAGDGYLCRLVFLGDTYGEFAMAAICAVCGKGPRSGNNVSHANNKTKRRWLPNLQPVRIVTENGTHKRIRACTSCISAGKIRKAG